MLRYNFATRVLVFAILSRGCSSQCIRDLLDIYVAELAVKNSAVKRTYTLCGGTTFKPTFLDPNTGFFIDDKPPLIVRANAHVKCGKSGNSKNNCKIDGTGEFGVLIDPLSHWQEENLGNIILEGITIDSFKRRGQIPVVASGMAGRITFQDCVFSNNQADPMFITDQFVFDRFSKRALQELPHSNELKQSMNPFSFRYYAGNPKVQDSLRSNIFDRNPLDIVEEEKNSTMIVATGRQAIQESGKLTISFDSCSFESNAAMKSTDIQNSLSIVRFRGRTPPERKFREFVGTLDARFIGCTFTDNLYSFTGDPALYRSLIDFYSKGTLEMRLNQFRNSRTKNFGLVTVQNTAKLTVAFNSILPEKQPDLRCAFIARLSSGYTWKRCGPQPTPPMAIPAVCFPADAFCDVEGQGNVMMRDLKLGDRVLVKNDTYESIYSFGHFNDHIQADYIRLITSVRPFLEMSKEHMVFVVDRGAVPASSVIVGDKLLMADGDSTIVQDIHEVRKRGAFAPFTASGTIIVNGIKASSFVALQDSATLNIAGFDTGLSFQFLVTAFEGPHRFWCHYVSTCLNEDYTPDGMSLWLDVPYKYGRWLVQQHPYVMSIIGVPTLTLLIILAYPVEFLLTIALTFCLFSLKSKESFRLKTSRRWTSVT